MERPPELDRPESAVSERGASVESRRRARDTGTSSLARLVSIATVSRNCCRPSPVFSWSAPRHPQRDSNPADRNRQARRGCWSTPRQHGAATLCA